jgi:hypothetical protein
LPPIWVSLSSRNFCIKNKNLLYSSFLSIKILRWYCRKTKYQIFFLTLTHAPYSLRNVWLCFHSEMNMIIIICVQTRFRWNNKSNEATIPSHTNTHSKLSSKLYVSETPLFCFQLVSIIPDSLQFKFQFFIIWVFLYVVFIDNWQNPDWFFIIWVYYVWISHTLTKSLHWIGNNMSVELSRIIAI